jgi:uncharacterized protein
MVNNPFKYGELSAGADFCNRKAELKRIHQAFLDGQNLVLISPRRWGKSSLVEQALRTHKTKHLVAKLDCFGLRSEEEFYRALLIAVLKASETRLQGLADSVRKFLSALVPYISYSVGPQEELKISVSLPREQPDPFAILDLAQKIAADKKVNFIICIDEFQKIGEWENDCAILERLRSHWQKHKRVSYCLYGSKRHLMTVMFTDSSGPFYRFGETIFLAKISRAEWVTYCVHQFAKSRKKISAEHAGRLADLVGCHSYYVQYLGRLCWNNTSRVVSSAVLEQSFQELLNDHEEVFRKLTDRLTHYQVNYLKAICAGERQLTSQRVLRDYHLGSAGNIKRIEKVMEDLEILDYFGKEPTFSDPYFEPLFRKYFM